MPDKHSWTALSRSFYEARHWHAACLGDEMPCRLPKLGPVLAVALALFAPTPADACQCSPPFRAVGAREWAYQAYYEEQRRTSTPSFPDNLIPDTNSVPPVEVSGPFVILMDAELGEPVLRLGEREVGFAMERIRTDASFCGADLVRITPEEDFERGTVLTLVSPDYEERVGPERSQFDVIWGDPRPLVEGEFELTVDWEHAWPHVLEFCGVSGALYGQRAYGYASLYVQSDLEAEFYGELRSTLPGGEEYRELSVSRHRYSTSSDKPLGGAELSLGLPLTNSALEPECLHITLYDHTLRPFFDEELCPEEEGRSGYGLERTRRLVTAATRTLPPYPEGPPEEPAPGCSKAAAPQRTSTALLNVLLAVPFLLRRKGRRRVSSDPPTSNLEARWSGPDGLP